VASLELCFINQVSFFFLPDSGLTIRVVVQERINITFSINQVGTFLVGAFIVHHRLFCSALGVVVTVHVFRLSWLGFSK
jgi:hypothetical protein